MKTETTKPEPEESITLTPDQQQEAKLMIEFHRYIYESEYVRFLFARDATRIHLLITREYGDNPLRTEAKIDYIDEEEQCQAQQ